MQMLGNRVLLRLEETANQRGLIHVPDTARDASFTGTVTAIGPDVVFEGMLNQRVVFGKYSGSKIELGGAQCLILSEDDVLAIIEPGDGI